MSKPINAAFIALALCVPILLSAQNQAVPPQPLAIEGATTHVYKAINGVELRLHVFNPLRPVTKAPAIVFFFGGGWVQGSIEQFAPQAGYLAQRGMIAIVADYRVFGRHQTSPFESIADAKSAIRWVRSHAVELGVDPNRIVAAGGSAGGHIALTSALLETFDDPKEDAGVSSKPNALVLFNPVVMTNLENYKARFGARGLEASPLQHISRSLPPMIIFHGKADTTVPYAHVEAFCNDSRKLLNQCELFGYEGASHGFFNPQISDGKWYRETLLEADRFLTRIGYLPKPSPTQLP